MSDRCPLLARLCEPVVTARVLVIAAHPDDETIGAGSVLARSVDPWVVIVTDGAPRDSSLWPASAASGTREAYTALRQEELAAALAEAGIARSSVRFLDVVDGEVIDAIEPVVTRLVGILEEIQPDIVLTHAYEGGHVDHDATALAVHTAMAVTGRGHPHEIALYHGWGGQLAVHEFPPGELPSRTVTLTPRLAALKSRMLAHYTSQRRHEVYFGVEREAYRCAPEYDFRQSPDPDGALLYERSGGPMTGVQWRERARAALEQSASIARTEPQLRQATAAPDTFPPSAATPGARACDGLPLVSVIVRFTGRETVDATLDSITAQTYPHIEVVIVDAAGNGSPAWTPVRDGLIVRRCGGQELGRSRAANAGLDASTGDYVIFLDDDDWFHPEHVATLEAAAHVSPEARVVYGGVEVVEWGDGLVPVRVRVFDAPYDPVALVYENYIPINAAMVARSLLDEGCRFDEELPLLEDWDFWIQLSRRTAFQHVPGTGAVYRWPPSSGVTDPSRTAAAQERIFRKWCDALAPAERALLLQKARRLSEASTLHVDQLQSLQAHLAAQNGELERLRPCVAAQDAQLAELRHHLARQDTELERLRSDANTKDDLIAASKEHERLRQIEMQTLREHVATQDEELAKLRPCVASQEAQLAELRDHLAAQDAELAQLRPCITAQEAQLAELRGHLGEQDAELGRLRPYVVALEGRLAEYREHGATIERELLRLRLALDTADRRLQMMSGSASWKITAPLRAAHHLLKPRS